MYSVLNINMYRISMRKQIILSTVPVLYCLHNNTSLTCETIPNAKNLTLSEQ